ncbi:hypothetical protein GUJ93_ZPchr0014g46512 [Zizania palustris]|uniref:Uncharacterized protein n=1 Tax=Zizania palustris TaxID=103762 RepID=A0A8J5SWX3_ZIZPA|nr:hypothetical protein GUJ93_ZPchr0014g46512 [Zizania palustris]
MKSVGEGLETREVIVDGGVTLLKGTKLDFNLHDTMQIIISDETLDGTPDGEYQHMWSVHDVEDALVDRHVETIHDAMVVENPLDITLVKRVVGSRRATSSQTCLAQSQKPSKPSVYVARRANRGRSDLALSFNWDQVVSLPWSSSSLHHTHQ